MVSHGLPQTVVGGGCAGAQLLPEDFFLGKECSLDREEEKEEGVEGSLILLGMNCFRAADYFGGAKFLHHRANRLFK